MNDLAAQAKKVGINISADHAPVRKRSSARRSPCTPRQPTCKWTAENWGAGWIYGPDYLPTGESLYAPGSAANCGSYIDPKADDESHQRRRSPVRCRRRTRH